LKTSHASICVFFAPALQFSDCYVAILHIEEGLVRFFVESAKFIASKLVDDTDVKAHFGKSVDGIAKGVEVVRVQLVDDIKHEGNTAGENLGVLFRRSRLSLEIIPLDELCSLVGELGLLRFRFDFGDLREHLSEVFKGLISLRVLKFSLF